MARVGNSSQKSRAVVVSGRSCGIIPISEAKKIKHVEYGGVRGELYGVLLSRSRTWADT